MKPHSRCHCRSQEQFLDSPELFQVIIAVKIFQDRCWGWRNLPDTMALYQRLRSGYQSFYRYRAHIIFPSSLRPTLLIDPMKSCFKLFFLLICFQIGFVIYQYCSYKNYLVFIIEKIRHTLLKNCLLMPDLSLLSPAYFVRLNFFFLFSLYFSLQREPMTPNRRFFVQTLLFSPNLLLDKNDQGKSIMSMEIFLYHFPHELYQNCLLSACRETCSIFIAAFIYFPHFSYFLMFNYQLLITLLKSQPSLSECLFYFRESENNFQKATLKYKIFK